MKNYEQIKISCKQRSLVAYDFQFAVRTGKRIHGDERTARFLESHLDFNRDNVGAVGGNSYRQHGGFKIRQETAAPVLSGNGSRRNFKGRGFNLCLALYGSFNLRGGATAARVHETFARRGDTVHNLPVHETIHRVVSFVFGRGNRNGSGGRVGRFDGKNFSADDNFVRGGRVVDWCLRRGLRRTGRKVRQKTAAPLFGDKIRRGGALNIARELHVVSIVCFVAVGLMLGLGKLYFVGVAIAAAALVYQHAIVRPNDFREVTQAYFMRNGIVSIAIFIFTWLSYD